MVCTKCVNHSLFRMLLDKAEKEFEYTVVRLFKLPCGVELF